MIQGKSITLRPARLDERKLIFDMAMKTDILNFSESYNSTFEEFEDDYTERYFDSKEPSVCGGMMICENNSPVGFISYGQVSFGQDGINPGIMELDIWMDGEKCCGKGLGTDAIITLADYLHSSFTINTFIMVPSKLNLRAIRSYEKAGFFKILPNEKQSILKRVYVPEYLNSLESASDYLTGDNVLMLKEYTPQSISM